MSHGRDHKQRTTTLYLLHFGRQFAVQQQKGDIHKVGLLHQTRDRVTAVRQQPFGSIDESDGGRARRSGREARVVREQTGLSVQLLDVDARRTGGRNQQRELRHHKPQHNTAQYRETYQSIIDTAHTHSTAQHSTTKQISQTWYCLPSGSVRVTVCGLALASFESFAPAPALAPAAADAEASERMGGDCGDAGAGADASEVRASGLDRFIEMGVGL
jgi:hypothetical protein